MEIAKSFITDESGSIKSVIIDFETYKKLEEVLMDHGLAKAMDEVEDDDTLSAEEARLLLKE